MGRGVDILIDATETGMSYSSKILLNVLHNLSWTVLLPCQHTGIETSPILKAFLATFGVPFSYLQMVPHIHDPTSILICSFKFVALFNIFRAENHLPIEIKWVGTGKECVPMGTKCFMTVGVFCGELLAYQVSTVCTANFPR